MALVTTFKKQLTEYLTKSTDICDNLVIFENNSNCDFSFVRNFSVWRNYLKNTDNLENVLLSNDILTIHNNKKSENEAIEALKRESEKWVFKIDKIKCDPKRYFIHLHRSSTYMTTIADINTDVLSIKEKDDCETISIDMIEGEETEKSSISYFRVKTIASVLKNIIIYATRYVYVKESSDAKHKLLLTTSSNFKISKNEQHIGKILVNCGVVVNDDNKKLNQTANEYLTGRTNDMHLIAIHKYGVRMKNDKNFLDAINALGTAAAVLDMVEVKHSHVMKLNKTSKQSFILYNSARLETLLANFNEKVQEGYYEDVKPMSENDAALLTEDLEWELLKMILAYPEIIQKTSCDIEKGKINIHLLYKYLYTFMMTFSMFYGKIKVLTENRPQLLPILHAKIHLLRAVQKYLNHTLKIFNIEPVLFM